MKVDCAKISEPKLFQVAWKKFLHPTLCYLKCLKYKNRLVGVFVMSEIWDYSG